MRRVIIRNLKSSKQNKPRLFDALIDGDKVFFEIKNARRESEMVELMDVIKQLQPCLISERPPPKESSPHAGHPTDGCSAK